MSLKVQEPTKSVADERARTAPPRRGRARSERRSVALTVAVWLSLVYFLLPFAWLLVASTKSNEDLFSTFGLAFANFNLWDNLADLFGRESGVFLRWTLNTVWYAGVSAVGATVLASICGYALAKYDFPGRRFVFAFILGAIMIPATALAIPTYLLFSQVGLTNSPLAVILPSIISPFGVYLMRVYAADAVDDSLIEAARIDGAGELRILWRIAMPLLGPGMVTVFLFTLVHTWNNYFLPLIMLNSPGLYPLTVGLAQWQSAASAQGGGSTADFSTIITGSFVSILPLVVAFLYLQRYWQSGLAAGGVKA